MNNKFNTIIIDPGHGGVDLGFDDGVHYEKDFNLEMGKKIYKQLSDLGFPVYLTRDEDITISNYDRFEFLDKITEENNGKSLVFSVQVDDENPDGVNIIRSINKPYEDNQKLYERLNSIGSIGTKVLSTDDEKDFYAIQRLTPDGSESIVIEFGYNILNELDVEKDKLGRSIANVIIDYFGDINFSNGYDNYIVKKGDNLSYISRIYNTSVSDLMKINNLGTDFLSVGQVLKVPKLKGNIYIIKKGDSLYSIAKKFNTSVDKIKEFNNLNSDKLTVNQKIVIPN